MKKFFTFLSKHLLATILVLVFVATVVITSCLGALVFTRFSKGVVPTDDDLGKTLYERVVIIGVDGAGGSIGETDTPSFDRIFGNGAVTYKGWSQFPTISAHNWTSALHGVRYQTHKINNNKAETRKFTNEKYPSVFKVLEASDPTARFISACSWYPINNGIVEDSDSTVKISGPTDKKPPEDDLFLEKADIYVTEEYIKTINDGVDPKITFIHYSQVDEYGHEYGRRSSKYFDAIKTVDVLIGEIYDAIDAKGWAEDTLFILMTDHGHRYYGGHGLNGRKERQVTVAVYGAHGDVIKGTPSKVVTQDVASITLYALGIKQPSVYESKVPYNIFNTLPTV